ncbi:ubiquitin carboxyl-terminal hydrolase 8-like isoform X2 [Ostrea edulis]|uniref:ubiquitin carboxyl-terminal hydrolase 8-like isoform X2 n=1 Tax=Ostrea edulis TaxID=37623 RepID=UPI0024AFBCC4|nr:ubiquitin carboxyl-terminal hydrolase 8-like isoform X2 [Ostrea edulis]
MPVKKKDLYVAKSLKALNDLAALPAKMTNNPKILLKSAEKIHKEAELHESLGDEEKAYIMCMKYFNVVTLIRKSAEYKKHKDYFDSLIGQKNLLKSINKAEELSANLKDRYELAEAEEVASKLSPLEDNPHPKEEPVRTEEEVKKPIETENTDKPVEPAPQADGRITPVELYRLLNDKETNLIIMDVRPASQYGESHIKHDACISVPAEVIKPGTTVTYIEMALSEEAKGQWRKRGQTDHIILLDWNSTLSQVTIATPLRTLKDALFKYDSTVIIKSEPLVLEGGYDQWLMYYPQVTTNANVTNPTQEGPMSSAPSLDFDYPDFDEDFSLTPKPKPKPEVEASSDPLGLLNNVPDTAKPPIPTSGGQARPSVDRSTKPKPSPSNNSLNSIHNVFPTSQTDSKTISVPKNNLMAEAQRKEKRAAEEVVRSKEEEMRIQTEKDKEAEEQEAKRQKLQREIQELERLKMEQARDVADLMRKKKAIVEENQGDSRTDSHKKGEEERRKELAILDLEEKEKRQVQEEMEREKQRRLEEVERLRQERKRREEGEADRKALEKARENAKLEEERRKLDLKKAEDEAQRLLEEEQRRAAQQKAEADKLEAQRKAEADKLAAQQKVEADRLETQKKKEEEEQRETERRRQQEEEQRKEEKRQEQMKKVEEERLEKEKADLARKEAEEKLRRLNFAESQPSKPKTIPSPNLPSGWEKRLDLNTRRYYYINHNKGSTQWESPYTQTSQPPGQLSVTKLKDEPTTPKRGLTRSNSSPNIAKMMFDEEQAPKTLPTVNRAMKPQPRVDHPQPKPRKALHRDLNPVYGNVGRALTGLRNLGNTCYMNSTIQCLNNTSPLATYFLTDMYLYDINRESQLGYYGEVADDFSVIIKALWSGQYKCITPRDFKFIVGKHNPEFAGTTQQDSHDFLTFLMDGLHEGLNKVKKRPEIPEQENDNLPDNQAAEIAWRHHQLCNESIIVELFQGQLKSTLMCLHCRKMSVNFQAFMFLTLPLPSSSRCSLGDCLKLFLKEEKLTGSSRWRCPRCKVDRDAVKKIDIWRLPRILLIGLNRFVYKGQWREKINSHVDFPARNLDLNPYLDGPKSTKTVYKLYATSNHTGTLDGGHYTAYCRSPCTQNWYKYDDDHVSEISESSVRSSSAYVLYYTSVELTPPNFRQHF